MEQTNQFYIFSENPKVVTNQKLSDEEIYERTLNQSDKSYGGDNIFKI